MKQKILDREIHLGKEDKRKWTYLRSYAPMHRSVRVELVYARLSDIWITQETKHTFFLQILPEH